MMDDYQRKQILDKFSSVKSVLIAVSLKSGFDGLASGLALYLSIKKFGKTAAISASDPTVNDANNLYGVDKINKLEGKEDLVVVINDAINTVDKVTYNLDGDELKIKVHALSGSQGVSPNSVSLEKAVSYPETVIAIGFNSAGEMKNEITHEQINSSTRWIMSINRDKPSEKFAQIELSDPAAATISELTTKIITNLALPFDEDISFNLYSGIKITTNMFSPKNTAPSTLEAAQHLIKLGAGSASLASPLRRIEASESGRSMQGTTSFDRTPSIKPQISDEPHNPLYTEEQTTPLEEVETKEASKESWLKPPKIYRGSKSFDRES